MALFDSGILVANVELSDTFDTWRVRTNQISTQAAGLASNNIYSGALNTFNNTTSFKGAVTAPAINVDTGSFAGPVTAPTVTANNLTEGGSAVLAASDVGVTVQAYNAGLLNDADIGVSVQGYDATFLNDADIGVNVQGYDATLLVSADIGSTVQAYDAGLSYLDGLNFTNEATFKAGVNLEIGTDVLGYVAPGTSGNLLTSDGANWTSAAPSTGSIGTHSATAAGAISDGDPVVINANGTVSTVTSTAEIVGALANTNVLSNSANFPHTISYDASADRILISYQDSVTPKNGLSIVGSISGTTITWGSSANNGLANKPCASIYYPTENSTLLLDADSQEIQEVSISGLSITTGGNLASVSGFSGALFTGVYHTVQDKVVVVGRENGSGFQYLALCAIDLTSGTITQGTAVTVDGNIDNALRSGTSITYDSTNDDLVVYTRDTTSNTAYVKLYSLSGTTLTFEATVEPPPSTTEQIDSRVIYDSVNNKLVFYYHERTNNTGKISVATRSGNVFDYTIPQDVIQEAIDNPQIGYNPTVGRVILTFTKVSDSKGYVCEVDASGPGPIISEPVLIFDSATNIDFYADIPYNSSTGQNILTHVGSTSYPGGVVYQPEVRNLTQENFIGFSDGAYANNTTATVQLDGVIDDAQTGLTPGQKYYVQHDGTLSTSADLIPVEAGIALSTTSILTKG